MAEEEAPQEKQYSSSTEYAKYLKKKCMGEHSKCHDGCDEGCEGCNEGCGGCKDKECGCCPPGLVEVTSAEGGKMCLTPNDAQLYMANTFKCPDGYIRVIDDNGIFIGCLTPSEYAIYNESLTA